MAGSVEVFVEVHAATPDAILVEKDPEVWLPRSQVDWGESDLERNCGKGDSGNVVIPEWLAMNEGLI
jgi:hypothetical protein